ncbi:MAG: glycoside hydrolase family protein [Marinobacterium sp.]|nr:glycoside hydrolase family protein [Marinobacterium sp.]
MAGWDDLRKELKKSEGSIPYMYLDTVGKVTVGVGNMLPDVAAAQQLGFVERATGREATAAEIAADFNAVQAQPAARVASFYKEYTHLELPEAKIDELLNQRIREFEQGLKRNFPEFDSYPITAQMAMMDMAFNLGVQGLVTKFPSMTRAIRRMDWKAAAKESHRRQVSDSRNAVVKQWFDEAAG